MYLIELLWIILFTIKTMTIEGEFTFLLLHTNDMNGRFEEISQIDGVCKREDMGRRCFGGFGRIAHVVRQFRNRSMEGSGPPVIFLNAGNTFTGSAWFDVYNTDITANFMKLLSFDAIALGYTDFDLKPVGLADYLRQLTTPVVAANLDISREPALQQNQILKSTVLQIESEKIGIIGYITPATANLSRVGGVTFSDEMNAVSKEAEILTRNGVKIIIALGHSEYRRNVEMARTVDLVDVVVGGDSHTLLWNGIQPHKEVIEGPYPTIVHQYSGQLAAVVQAYGNTKYIGVLKLTFNHRGHLIHWSGNPMILDSNIPQAQDSLDLLEFYRPDIDQLFRVKIGRALVDLTGSLECTQRECNFGNFVTDAFVEYANFMTKFHLPQKLIGIVNGGSIRSSIEAGWITKGHLVGALRAEEHVVLLKMTGSTLLRGLEEMFRQEANVYRSEFPQVSGLVITVNLAKRPYSRLLSVRTYCDFCTIDYFRSIRETDRYYVVTTQFLYLGGDGITSFRDSVEQSLLEEIRIIDVLSWYINRVKLVNPEIEDRIVIISGGMMNMVSFWFMFVNVYVLTSTLS